MTGSRLALPLRLPLSLSPPSPPSSLSLSLSLSPSLSLSLSRGAALVRRDWGGDVELGLADCAALALCGIYNELYSL